MEEIKEELRQARDQLLNSIKSFLTAKIWVEDAEGFQDFVRYVARYTSSELFFMIRDSGYESELEAFVEKIQSSEQKVNNDAK